MPESEQANPGPTTQPGLPTQARAITDRLAARLGALGDGMIRYLERRGVGEPTIVIGMAALIGTLVGAGILVFYFLIDEAARLAEGSVRAVAGLTGLPLIGNVVILAGGLVVARLVVRHFTADSPGENIPDVMDAVARRGGVVHSMPVLFKTAAAAVTLGAGGSVGAEGPVAVLGAALASRSGRFFRFSSRRLRLMVGSGTAAGIAGAFGAPMAGVFFALEKLLGEARGTSLAPLVVACAAAGAVTKNGLGSAPVIAIPGSYGVKGAKDLVLYSLVALLAGLVAVAYNRLVWRTQDAMDRLPWPWRVAIAALAIGGLASLFDPALWAGGHLRLDLGLVGTTTAGVLLALAFAKVAATALTLAGGGVGGVFTPALVIGGSFGAGLAAAADTVVPGLTIQPVAAGLVGMAAVVSGSMHAPFTAVFMVLEMTNDYGLVLPLLLGSALALVVAKNLHPESIYSEWLARRGERVAGGMDEAVLARLTVREALRQDGLRLPATMTVDDALARVEASGRGACPVVSDGGILVGLAEWESLKAATRSGLGHWPVLDLVQPPLELVTLDESLLTALRRLGLRDAALIPVIDHPERRRLVGVIGRGDVLAAYDHHVG